MKSLMAYCAVFALLCLAAPARASVQVVFGKHIQRLQNLVDSRYGPGHIDVTTDYIGAHAGDPDPWSWTGTAIVVRLVKEVTQNGRRDTIGWYEETGVPPVCPGGGVVFDAKTRNGEPAIRPLGRRMKFGFYLRPCGPHDGENVAEGGILCTNRLFNSPGPDGTGAIHPPYDGDVQALIFDVSRWTQPNTWLVCFEDGDSGADPAPNCGDACAQTDNDFDDMVFEVSATGTVDASGVSFGLLKQRYRH